MSEILGLGTDLVEIARIRSSIEGHGHRFKERLFTEAEIATCESYDDPAPHYAGRFAAKEAIAKALGTGFGATLAFLDIEIRSDAKGKPLATLSPKIEEEFGPSKILITISHEKHYATATALWLKRDRRGISV